MTTDDIIPNEPLGHAEIVDFMDDPSSVVFLNRQVHWFFSLLRCFCIDTLPQTGRVSTRKSSN
jgi:hypothetical protein